MTTTLKAVKSFDFATAVDLFDWLSPSKSNWHSPRREPALYRGHRVADWPLIPTVLRSHAWLTDGVKWYETSSATTEQEQVELELATLKYFWEESDRQGLRLPEDNQALRKTIYGMEKILEEGNLDCQHHFWPRTEMLSLLALAQHSGVPTRLLDWTWDPYVAAYFAASGILRADKLPAAGDRIALWELLLAVVEGQEYIHGKEPEDWLVRLVTAPTADNSNLRAQRGAFTLHNTIRYKPTCPRMALPLDQVLDAALPNFGEPASPALTKLTLPAAEAPKLLLLLSQQGYHAGSLFPGFEGIAQLMSERRKLYEFLESGEGLKS